MSNIQIFTPDQTLRKIRETPDENAKFQAEFIARWYMVYQSLGIPESRQLPKNQDVITEVLIPLADRISQKMSGFTPEILWKVFEIGVTKYLTDNGNDAKATDFRVFDEPTLWLWISRYRDEAVSEIFPEPDRIALEARSQPDLYQPTTRDLIAQLASPDARKIAFCTPVYDGIFKNMLDQQPKGTREHLSTVARDAWMQQVSDLFSISLAKIRQIVVDKPFITAFAETMIKQHIYNKGGVTGEVLLPSFRYLYRCEVYSHLNREKKFEIDPETGECF